MAQGLVQASEWAGAVGRHGRHARGCIGFLSCGHVARLQRSKQVVHVLLLLLQSAGVSALSNGVDCHFFSSISG